MPIRNFFCRGCKATPTENNFPPPPPIEFFVKPKTNLEDSVDKLKNAISIIKSHRALPGLTYVDIPDAKLEHISAYVLEHRAEWKSNAVDLYLCTKKFSIPLPIHYVASTDTVYIQFKGKIGLIAGEGGMAICKFSARFEDGMPFVNRFADKKKISANPASSVYYEAYEKIDPEILAKISKIERCVQYSPIVSYQSHHSHYALGFRQTNACIFYPKGSLVHFINKNRQVLKWLGPALIEALRTLQIIHDADICWRDIKTDNLFITEDFKLHFADPFLAINLTKPIHGPIGGTEEYTPRDIRRQIGLTKDMLKKGDIYAMGLVIKILYEHGNILVPLFNRYSFKKFYESLLNEDFTMRPNANEAADTLEGLL